MKAGLHANVVVEETMEALSARLADDCGDVGHLESAALGHRIDA